MKQYPSGRGSRIKWLKDLNLMRLERCMSAQFNFADNKCSAVQEAPCADFWLAYDGTKCIEKSQKSFQKILLFIETQVVTLPCALKYGHPAVLYCILYLLYGGENTTSFIAV